MERQPRQQVHRGARAAPAGRCLLYTSELRQSFVSVLPILFCVILLVSLATVWVYSRIITNPVLKISRISKEMSDLKLEWQLEERRSDELGVLANRLNTLSRKLSATLEELQSANLQLQKDIDVYKRQASGPAPVLLSQV